MRAPLLLAGFWLLTGCETIAYYHQSVQGHFELLAARRPIPEVLDDPAVANSLKSRLREVAAIRRFATTSLGLPDNDSYMAYADVGREVLLWNLVATPEFSLRPRQWCYPVIGCASYRGYFDRRQAESYAQRLVADGLDIALLPVPAYSSLGWFDDPVPNTVARWPLPELAALLFHELAHQRVYAAGDSAFNESYATVVAEVGVERWLVRTRGAAALADWRFQHDAKQLWLALLADGRQRLRRLYAQSMPVAQRRRSKAEILAWLRDEFELKARGDTRLSRYRRWFDAPLNNAHLASLDTYHRWIPALRELLRRLDGQFERFHAASEALAALDHETRQSRLQQLAQAAMKDAVQPVRRSVWMRACRSALPN